MLLDFHATRYFNDPKLLGEVEHDDPDLDEGRIAELMNNPDAWEDVQ